MSVGGREICVLMCFLTREYERPDPGSWYGTRRPEKIYARMMMSHRMQKKKAPMMLVFVT
jgi:hypothetical protein